jgi:hypothetical protein
MMRPGTAALSDALGKGGAMHHDMQCRSVSAAMAGPAFNVRMHSVELHKAINPAQVVMCEE